MRATIQARRISATLTQGAAGLVRRSITVAIDATGSIVVAATSAAARIAASIGAQSTVTALTAATASVQAAIDAAGALVATTTAGAQVQPAIDAAGELATRTTSTGWALVQSNGDALLISTGDQFLAPQKSA